MGYAQAELLTRQELADKIGRSYDFIYRNEKALGLDRCRININQRVVYYRIDLVVRAFVRVGLLVRTTSANNPFQVATTKRRL